MVTLIIQHPQRFQIIGRHHMLRFRASRKALNDLIGGGIDNIDSIAETIWDVEARWEIPHHRAQFVWPGLRVDVIGVKYWRHARQRVVCEPRRPRWRCPVCRRLAVTRRATCGTYEQEYQQQSSEYAAHVPPYPSETIPSATGLRRSSTRGSWPGRIRSGRSASSRRRWKP